MKCAICGHMNRSGVKFCAVCGSQLGATPKPPVGSTKHMQWWERLVFEQVKNKHTPCPTCKFENDSAQVLCESDKTNLATATLDKNFKFILINALRFIALGVGVLVGYLGWVWAPYLFAAFVFFSFFGLFLRNHRDAVIYWGISGALAVFGVLAWHSLSLPANASLIALSIALVFLTVCELVFVGLFTLRVGPDPRRYWLDSHKVTLSLAVLSLVSVMLTASLVLLIGFGLSFLVQDPSLASFLSVYGLRFAIVAFTSAQTTAIIASIVYSLRQPPIVIRNKWSYKPLLSRWTPILFIVPALPPTVSWGERFAIRLARLALRASNSMLRALARSYNSFLVRLVNALSFLAVKIANILRRLIIKMTHHAKTSILRLIRVNVWCLQWMGLLAFWFVRTFALPIWLIIISGFVLYRGSEDFNNYVHTGSLILLPSIALYGFIVTGMLSVATSLLLHSNFFRMLSRIEDPLFDFGFDALLVFWAIAWSLGLAGTFLSGPYRIGPVTIGVTLLFVSVAIFSVLRQRHHPTP